MATRVRKKPDPRTSPLAISVAGFKSLVEEQRIDVRPLTILAGANSSGKSSIVQPLLLIKQTLEVPYDPGPLLLNGPNVKFTSADQLLSHTSSSSKATCFFIKFALEHSWEATLSFERAAEGIQVKSIDYNLAGDPPKSYSLHEGMPHEEIAQLIPRYFLNFQKSQGGHWIIKRERCFLSVSLHAEDDMDLFIYEPPFSPRHLLEPYLSGIIHVQANRGNPERTYPTTAVGKEFPATFEQYVASIIRLWQLRQDRRLKELFEDLQVLGLTWKVEAKKLDDTSVELQVGRLPRARQGGARDLVNIADVGFGVSQVLPVLVALRVAETGQIVYIEQPEIHLHPNAQTLLPKMLAPAAKRGVRLIIETHSSLLLRGIQTLVAEGELKADLVKLHWFSRDRQSGATTITPADLDEDGAFGDWPMDFDSVELQSERMYLDAVEKKR